MNHVEEGRLTNCNKCRFCHKMLSLSAINREICVNYICGLLGVTLATTQEDIKIEINKYCSYDSFELKLKGVDGE